jgi:hypothetical protein
MLASRPPNGFNATQWLLRPPRGRQGLRCERRLVAGPIFAGLGEVAAMNTTARVYRILTVGALLMGLAFGCVEAEKKSAPPGTKTGAPAAKGQPPAEAISDLVPPTAATSPLITEKDFVMDWLVLGPFQFKEDDFGGDQQQPSAEHPFVKNEGDLDGTQPAPEGTTWKAVRFKGDVQAGQVGLDKFYGTIDHAAAYAVAWLNCSEDIKDGKIYAGSDDYLKIWVNGKLVWTYKAARRSSNRDQDVVTGVTLRKGLNRIVVKCVDVVFDWDFYFRLTDSKDKPVSVKPKG